MNDKLMDTRFAPAERAPDEKLIEQRESLLSQPLFQTLLNALPDRIMILNPERQVLLANQAMLELLGLEGDPGILGLRPGEAMQCIHHADGPGGCGTSEYCRTCGAVRAVLTSQAEGGSQHECRLTIKQGDQETPLELLVWATRFPYEAHDLTIVAISDIGHEKRRRVLERIFFHDILNTAGSLRGFAELLKTEAGGPTGEIADHIYQAARILVNEIEAHRHLLAAENNELSAQWHRIMSLDFLQSMAVRYLGHEVARDRKVLVEAESCEVEFYSDPVLLGRVVGNLLKNAIEAVRPGEPVTLGCVAEDRSVEFRVHNPGHIPRDIQMQIFQRSFSTKGSGRGLGTYSAKLLATRYLYGRVSFDSTPERGTVFRARLLRYPPEASVTAEC
ncbi:MAG: PAS domain-containing protein [Proteobacteria bacterium]|nr:PAS domain-containing protein [Pseudomonadota bacterium]